MVERIKSRKGVGQKPKYLLFLEALNRIYRTLQSDSVTVIKIVIKADYLGFLISYNLGICATNKHYAIKKVYAKQ